MNRDFEISGYSYLAAAFAITFPSEIALFTEFLLLSNRIFQLATRTTSSFTSEPLAPPNSLALLIGVIGVIGMILELIALISLYIGFRTELEFYDVVKIANAEYGGVLVVIGFFLYSILFVIPVYLLFIPVIGIGLAMLGFALMKGALDSIGNKYNESLINAGAILNIIPIISILGTLITAVGLVRVINKAKSGQIKIAQPSQSFSPNVAPQPATQQSQPFNIPQPVSQIGLGLIKENGEISLALYSQVQGTIILAKIEGTSYFSALSIPLQVGYNNVIINMGMKLNLVKSAMYKITLVISTPSATIPVTVDAIYNP
nr:DUF973 family protein [Sulfolobus neozealandicus]